MKLLKFSIKWILLSNIIEMIWKFNYDNRMRQRQESFFIYIHNIISEGNLYQFFFRQFARIIHTLGNFFKIFYGITDCAIVAWWFLIHVRSINMTTRWFKMMGRTHYWFVQSNVFIMRSTLWFWIIIPLKMEDAVRKQFIYALNESRTWRKNLKHQNKSVRWMSCGLEISNWNGEQFPTHKPLNYKLPWHMSYNRGYMKIPVRSKKNPRKIKHIIYVTIFRGWHMSYTYNRVEVIISNKCSNIPPSNYNIQTNRTVSLNCAMLIVWRWIQLNRKQNFVIKCFLCQNG